MVTQEIDLNLIPSSEPVIVHVSQFDEGYHRLICHLYSGATPYTPTDATVKVQGTKPDNHAFQYYCDIDGSTAYVDINVQMTAVKGRVPTQLVVSESTGLTGTFAFELDVQESTLHPDIDISETDLPIYTEEAQEAARRAVQSATAAAASASEAEAWSAHPPYVGLNKHWFVYDIESEGFIDSGVYAEGVAPYIGENKHWYVFDVGTETFIDSGIVAEGKDGSMWYRGTAVEGKLITPTVFPTGITMAHTNDQYLNAEEGAIYHCVTPGDEDTATWVYDFTMSGGGGGGTDNYNDLINQPSIGGVTLVGNKTITELGGVQSFNGRSGSILPIAGDYDDSKISTNVTVGGVAQANVNAALTALDNEINGIDSNIPLASIMHIGGETQSTTQEALEALDNLSASLDDETDALSELYYHMNRRERRDITSDIQADNGVKLIQAVAEQNLAKYGYAIGDYFTGASGQVYHLGDMDCNYGGYTSQAVVATHHIGIVVDSKLDTPWLSTGTLTNYSSSTLHSFLKSTVINRVKSDFRSLFGGSTGEEHLLLRTELDNAIGGWGTTWTGLANTLICAMTEVPVWNPSTPNTLAPYT